MTVRPVTGIPALEEALRFHARGWSVVPMAGKRPHPGALEAVHGSPKWDALRTRRASPPEIAAWFAAHPDAGLGLIVPEGVVVVDIDQPGRFPHRHPVTPTVATRRGWHLYFRGDVDGVHDSDWGEVTWRRFDSRAATVTASRHQRPLRVAHWPR